jgi:DNA polymerase (family 10)
MHMPTPDDAGVPSPTAAVAQALREIGALVALEPGSRFRARAYERGAAVVAALPGLESLLRSGQLTTVPGIGPALARTIEEIARTGRSAMLERLRGKYPPGAVELSRVLALSRVGAVHDALGVTTLAELRAACEAGRVRTVRGFGEKSERQLLRRIDALATRREAVTLAHAEQQGEALRAHLLCHPAIGAAELAGEFRRRAETIDRLDLVVSSADAEAVAAHMRQAPGLVAVRDAGPGRWLVHRAGAIDAHVRVVPRRDFAPAWIAATGAAAHTAKLGRVAARKGLTLDDRSLRRGARHLAVPTEAALYDHLGLAYIPPELREDAGEIEAAAAGRLPDDLVRLEDVQGAVHCHTVWSDGRHSVEEMAHAADALGLRYLTITDHSASATYAHGLDADRLHRQWDEIDRVQQGVAVRLLRGTESDILRDGALDFPDSVLCRLDVIIASIHNRFRMDADEMTRRLVRAMRHPLFKIWGHALGRYVLSRPPFACLMDEVLDAVADSRAAIEVNGDPHRLDLAPEHIRAARRRGIRFVVSADAHSTSGLRNLRWGVDMARRGWLRRDDVLNTRSADDFAAAVRP